MKVIRNWIDLETSGLREEHGIIQLSGIIDIDGEKVDEYTSYIKLVPGDIISPESTKSHGITTERIKTFPLAMEVKELLLRYWAQYIDQYDRRRKFHFCGYNAHFDIKMLSNWFTNKLGYENFWSWFWFPPVDVMSITMDKFAEHRHKFKNFKLPTVAELFGEKIEEESLHDASYDIELTRNIYYKLQEEEHVRDIINKLDARTSVENEPITRSGFKL